MDDGSKHPATPKSCLSFPFHFRKKHCDEESVLGYGISSNWIRMAFLLASAGLT
jgi:hypothetical protein